MYPHQNDLTPVRISGISVRFNRQVLGGNTKNWAKSASLGQHGVTDEEHGQIRCDKDIPWGRKNSKNRKRKLGWKCRRTLQLNMVSANWSITILNAIMAT